VIRVYLADWQCSDSQTTLAILAGRRMMEGPKRPYFACTRQKIWF